MPPQSRSARARPAADAAFEQRLEAALVARIDERRYDIWFRAHTKFALSGDRLTVGVPNLFSQEWLEKTFAGAIADAAAEVLGRPVAVRFAIDPELFQQARAEQEKVRSSERGVIRQCGARSAECGVIATPHSPLRTPHSELTIRQPRPPSSSSRPAPAATPRA